MSRRLAWLLGAILLLQAPLVAAVELTGKALRAGPLRIRYQPEVARAARELATRAPALCQVIAAELGVEPPEAEVRLVRRARDLRQVAPPRQPPPSWATGVTYPRIALIVLAQWSPKGDRQHLPTLLKHEYSHLALAHAAGFRPLPRWFVEGFAHLQAQEHSLGRTQTLAVAAATGRLVPLAHLDRRFPHMEDVAALAYAQSYDFVGYLRERGGPPRLARLLRGIAAGRPFGVAFRESYGRSLRSWEEAWRLDVRRRYLWWPLLTTGALLWMIMGPMAVVAFFRRRRAKAARLQRWAEQERQEEERRAAVRQAALDGADVSSPRGPEQEPRE